MCIGYCNICGCKMKAIPSFCYTLQYLLRCNLISTWTDLQNLPESDRAVVILVCSNFSNKIIFPKNDYIKYLQQICMCVCAPYKPHRQSACKHEHVFNQAIKRAEYKGHQSRSCSELFCPPGEGAWLVSLLQLSQNSVAQVLCAWLHFPSDSKEQTSRR